MARSGAGSRPGSVAAASALIDALRRPRFEVLPFDRSVDQVGEHLGTGCVITVTASSRRGLEPTLQVATELAERGYPAVPHLAARGVYDEQHLREILCRLQSSGIQEIFVIAGDNERPQGRFTDSTELLSAIGRLRADGVGRGLEQVGIGGYPGGHPFLGPEALTAALDEKQQYADYLVSQICFDAEVISGWIRRLRQSGIGLPGRLGVVGAVDRRKLLATLRRIGITDSARFWRKRRGLTRVMLPGAYRPTRLLRRLADDMADPACDVLGLHLYTLGDVAATERWRQRTLNEALGRG